MQAKNLFTLIIKIVGIIALWKAIQGFGGLITSFGMVASLLGMKGSGHSSFMLSIAFAMMMSFLVPLVVAYGCLLKTDWVAQKMKLNTVDATVLPLEPKHSYHLAIVIFGCLAILNGLAGFVTISYNEDTKTEHTQHFDGAIAGQKSPTTSSETNTVTNSKKKTVNYFALVALLFGIILLVKSKEATQWLIAKVPADGQKRLAE